MTEDRKGRLDSLAEKIKAAATAKKDTAEDTSEKTGGSKLPLGGNKPTSASGTKPTAIGTPASAKPTATTTTSTAKPTAIGTPAAKPTGTLSTKPTGTTTVSSAKPTATAATASSAKPTATATATTTSTAKPTAAATATAAASSASAAVKFNDVPAGAYYASAVTWALRQGITGGTSDTTFSPDKPCHRGHVATFLWRAKGSPKPKTAKNPFTDVAADSPFCQAILWAVENKIMEGTSATTFAPTQTLTREEVLVFLMKGTGKTGTKEAAANWATEKRLLTGQTGGISAPCTRADIVTYLYRIRGDFQ